MSQEQQITEQIANETETRVIKLKPKQQRKRNVVGGQAEPTATQIAPQVALPLTMEESLFGNQEIDAEAVPDEVIDVMTEEECALAKAKLDLEKAAENYKTLQETIAKSKLKENIVQYRADKVKAVGDGITSLDEKIAELVAQRDAMNVRLGEIERGEFDEMILNEAYFRSRNTEPVPREKVARTPKKKGEYEPHTFEGRVKRIGEMEIEIYDNNFKYAGNKVTINDEGFSAEVLQGLMDGNTRIKRVFQDICENSVRRQRKRPSEETIAKFFATI
jgi:hypothetical protein